MEPGDCSEEGALRATDIPVSLFREILMWPLALHLTSPVADAHAIANAVAATAERLAAANRQGSSPWQLVEDPLEHITPPPVSKDPSHRDYPGELERRRRWEAASYAEGVYFHEYVQGFLFARPPKDGRAAKPDRVPFWLFRRSDVAAVEVGLPSGAAMRLRIERLNLYLFRSGAAILVLELLGNCRHGTRALTLAEVEDFHDCFRRAYVPFVQVDKGASFSAPDLVVRSVRWELAPGGAAPPEPVVLTPDALHAALSSYLVKGGDDLGRRFPPILDHWRWLLAGALPLAPYDRPDDEEDRRWAPGEGRWHHVVDERMPTIATVAVTNGEGDALSFYRRTRRGDLVRLCFADRSDRENDYPYDRGFLRSFEQDYCYERFRESGTLFLVSGYAFVAYGAGWFFETVIAEHVRRQYFQIGLLAHFQLACLLAFSARISRAVAEYAPATHSAERFEAVMHSIQDEYLEFVHRFHFTGVSNHLQAQELSALWRRHLRLDEIHQDLRAELTSATGYLFDRAASRGATTVERLSAIGALGVIGGLAFSFLGMNLLANAELLVRLLGFPLTDAATSILKTAWIQGTIVGLALTAFAWLVTGGMSFLRRMRERDVQSRHRRELRATFDRKIERCLYVCSAILAAASLVSSVLIWAFG